MRRKWIALAVATALGAAAFAATAGFGDAPAPDPRPAYATVGVELRPGSTPPGSARPGTKAKRPATKVVYLAGSDTVNTAPPGSAPGATGPYIDFELSAPKNLCPRVIDGGINAANVDLFQQGSYVRQGVYHVLMGLDDAAAATPVTIAYDSHLICLKGAR